MIIKQRARAYAHTHEYHDSYASDRQVEQAVENIARAVEKAYEVPEDLKNDRTPKACDT